MSEQTFSVEQLKSNARSASLAYAGLYVAAYETATKFGEDAVQKVKDANKDLSERADDLNARATEFFDELVARGEKVELPKAELPEIPNVELPEFAKFDMPEFKKPEIKLPETVSNAIETIKSKLPTSK